MTLVPVFGLLVSIYIYSKYRKKDKYIFIHLTQSIIYSYIMIAVWFISFVLFLIFFLFSLVILFPLGVETIGQAFRKAFGYSIYLICLIGIIYFFLLGRSIF